MPTTNEQQPTPETESPKSVALSKAQKALIFAAIVLIIFLLGFLVGYVPQMTRIQQIAGQNNELQSRIQDADRSLQDARTRIRLAALRDRITLLYVEVLKNNFGNALPMSSTFFDEVRDVLPEIDDPKLKSALKAILADRDTMTASLAKADPKTAERVDSLLMQLFNATKGYR